MVKPFVKWAGGKGNLLKILESNLPYNFAELQDVTYIEPFVGGGAMLFYMLTKYPNIKRAIINDVNTDLINCYKLIKNDPTKLIALLKHIKDEFYVLMSIEEKSKYYYKIREKYNEGICDIEERASYFIFLNKTCFNGLYRVNAKGKFNVPFGKYQKPNICDEDLIFSVHKLLQSVDIYEGSYQNIIQYIGKNYNFFYIDPPYRPLLGSPSFIEYTQKIFDDTEQEKLKLYCDLLTQRGAMIMQSNSNSIDCCGDSYFEKLYKGYRIKQIEAHRFINAHAGKREKEIELLIMNY